MRLVGAEPGIRTADGGYAIPDSRSARPGLTRLALYLILSNNHLMKSNTCTFRTRKPGRGGPRASAGSTPANSASSSRSCSTAHGRCRKRGSSTKSPHGKRCTATDLVRALGLDAGYLSRTLQTLQRRQIVARKPSKTDRRAAELALTAKGRAAFAELDGRSRREVAGLLGRLETADRAADRRMRWRTIEQALEPPAQPAGFLLRSHRPGDIGWIVSRHGALYAQEYGWDISFEALAAEIAAQFIRSYDASREHCWIAEIGGEPVGSVFLVKASDDVAKLRLLLVERKARGLGVGRALTGAMHPLCAGRPATRRSRCGPRASWSPRAESTSAPDFDASRKRSTTVLAPIWSARPGS